MSLIDKVALVTGDGRGIGAACCNALAEQGAALLVADIDIEIAREVVRGISESGGKALALELDVTSENAWSSSLERVRSEFWSTTRGFCPFVVHPCFVATPMLANLENPEIDLEEAMRQQIPLGHMAESEDIADAVVFLASDKARYITGSELVVDGGFTAC